MNPFFGNGFLASLIVIVVILVLIILFVTQLGGEGGFFGLDLWPYNKPDLTVGSGRIEGEVKYNGGNMPFMSFAVLTCGGAEVRVNNRDWFLYADDYWFDLLAGTYDIHATLYNYPQGDVMATQNYSSIQVGSGVTVTRNIEFGGNS